MKISRLFLIACLAPLLAACESSTEPDPRDFTGRWIITEGGTASSLGVECNRSGVLRMTHQGASISGVYDMRGQCIVNKVQATDDSRTAPIEKARVSDGKLIFHYGDCIYSTIWASGLGPDRIEGRVNCEMRVGGSTHAYAGSWSGTRVPEPLSSAAR